MLWTLENPPKLQTKVIANKPPWKIKWVERRDSKRVGENFQEGWTWSLYYCGAGFMGVDICQN